MSLEHPARATVSKCSENDGGNSKETGANLQSLPLTKSEHQNKTYKFIHPLNKLRIYEFIVMKERRKEGERNRERKGEGKDFSYSKMPTSIEEMTDSKVSMMMKLVTKHLMWNRIVT